ncbi:hypothetical protein pqer_cds_1121 [Pandoravirus quercus]|uniref:F-box incomplete domain containing protein n=2 Tax=Pandoravirus TaxID=2060084 RepID=A0A2U7UAR8_9VIRU|nr:hypothetical protein pqer_cds_1121 [Pandoravirus quercus]AVK75543.1 hypothetical protein pqer_cds_1121 [Pandoravirus quercus]QBZ81718.1 hypothetical protein pclt_cds_1136 [Pandoravirus celtis]
MQATQRIETTGSGSDLTTATMLPKESACNMQAMGGFDMLPVEIVALIITESLPARWRFCARPVCRLWKAILDAAGDENRNRPRNEYHDLTLRRCIHDVPWKSLKRARTAHGRLHTVACRWRRGAIVLASTVVEWARTRPDLWDHQPAVLAAWCMDWHRAPRGDIAKAFIASGREPLVRYAVGPLFLSHGHLYNGPQPSDRGRCGGRSQVQDAAEIISVAAQAGPATTALVTEMLDRINWHEIRDLTWFTAGDCPESFELLLRAWAARVCDNGPLCQLWESVAWTGAARIFARLLEIVATAGGDDDSRAPNNGHLDGDGSRARRRRKEVIPLAVRLATTWEQKAKACLSTAACRQHDRTPILAIARSRLTNDLTRRVIDKAWRRGCVANIRWCKENLGLPPTTLDRLHGTIGQRVDFFEWLFDPRGGGHVPADDAEIKNLFHMFAATNSACALWVAERWPLQSAAAGRIALTIMVDRVFSMRRHISSTQRKGYGSYGGLLERLVCVLDRCAPHAPSGDDPVGDCDLWASLLALGRVKRRWPWDDWHATLCYMWARATGNDDDAIDMLGGHGPCPTSQALWARWCRVGPVSLGDLGLVDADVSIIMASESNESPLIVADRLRHRGTILSRSDVLANSRASALALAAWLRSKGLLADH